MSSLYLHFQTSIDILINIYELIKATLKILLNYKLINRAATNTCSYIILVGLSNCVPV